MKLNKRLPLLILLLSYFSTPVQATLKYATGFESNSAESVDAPFAGISAVASPVKSGTYALKATTASDTSSSAFYYTTDTAGTASSVFQQLTFQFQVGVLPNVTSAFVEWQCSGAQKMYLKLDTSGHVLFGSSIAADGAASSGTITADSTWHKIQVKLDAGSSDVKVDDSAWATYATTVSSCTVLQLGVAPNNVTDTTATYYYDDLIGGDDGTAYIAASKLLFLPVISDNNRGTWVAGGGGTANLYTAMDNFPPVGVVHTSATDTTQIKNLTSGANQDAVFNVQNYTTGGLPAGATIDFVVGAIMGGPGTNVFISMGLWIASNPTQGAASTTRFLNAGVGTYPTRWRPGIGAFEISPAVTLGTSPTLTIRKITSTTNRATECWAGIYVGYTPASGCSQSIALMGVGCR